MLTLLYSTTNQGSVCNKNADLKCLKTKKCYVILNEFMFRKLREALNHKSFLTNFFQKVLLVLATKYMRNHQVLYIFLDFHWSHGYVEKCNIIWIAESFLSWLVHWMNNVPDQQAIYGCLCHWTCASMLSVKISTAFANTKDAVDLILNCMRVDWRNGIFVVFRSE